ncbi:uncharacterized protein si:ch211-67f24.7 [Gadus macrocephalus]|uniref:uncharacterized protein si:ch211-67f24.7 n=1 Tax=Gadus macrocephalus TaxID=80720 RepID=UPI0028CB43EF|nr:uncharacterized protein si:ch211-67f24.7 [Gadus macrocephalus]XP_059907466.1 uncharacterized protein si:ch211-67f24.7 [Gadus macrocephalus]
MKPQEGELVAEISKLQLMVSELKSGFSSALLELSQIQHGDSYLREEMEENRQSCQKKARRLETLVETLREELGSLQCQILQLDVNNRTRAQQADRGTTTTTQKESEPGEAARGRTQCEGCSGQPPPSSSSPRGRLLLHSYLQGLRAGLSGETDARQQVVMQLLHSEWEYVSTLNHLYDKYKNSSQMSREPYQSYLQFVDQMLQRHLVFRNTLQERLSADHWKSLVGDLLVQLIGHNNTAFMDVYIGYTTSLARFLSLELHRGDRTQKKTRDQTEREEGKLLSLLLAPVSRIHGYLGHIQNLLQWTSRDHPDCSLLLGSEKVLRETLSRCHSILEQDVQWEEDAHPTNQSGKCSGGPPACVSSASCCARSQQCQGPAAPAGPPARDQRDEQAPPQAAAVAMRCPSMHLECWSCSPVSRKRDRLAQGGPSTLGGPSTRDRGITSCFAPPPPPLLSPRPPGGLRPPETPPTVWETSDSGQGTSSQPTGRGDPDDAEDGETDQDDTSAFDYSSVTSGSPDGTLRTGPGDSHTGGDDEEEEEEEEEWGEEDSQVPVLLRPGCQRRRREAGRERTVCLRWQIPRLTPLPPDGGAAAGPGPGPGPCAEGPCLVGSYGKRLVSIRKGSPPLHPKSAFRPIWDDPSKQVLTQADPGPDRDPRTVFVPVPGPERDPRQVFVPVPGQARHTFQKFSQKREDMRQAGALQQLGSGHVGATLGHGGLWDDSEDSEGPCSTV